MTLCIALAAPFVLGVLLLLARDRVPGRVAAALGAVACLASGVLCCVAWDRDAGVDRPWIEPLNARLHLGPTDYSGPFLLMTALLGVLCCVWLVRRDTSTALVGLVLVVTAASLGVFASLDLLLFLVFFELALIPMWFVIAWWGDPHDPVGRRRAATRFLLFTVAGSALLLAGIVIVGLRAGTLQIYDVGGEGGLVVAAVLIALGLAVKTPLVPLHTWLPDAHSAAPTVGSVLLAGVFLKLGTYGLIVLGSVMLADDGFANVAPWLAVAGAAGIVWSALACYAQDDLKRMIAYSSIGHMGFVVIGLATGTDVGLAAAVFGSVAHGLITGLLFFLAGSLKDRYGTASMRAIGRGLYGRSPWLAVTFLFAAVASLGLPGLAGFWGEFLSLRALYEVGGLDKGLAWSALGVALLGVALTTAYFVRAVRLLAQGEPEPRGEDRDLDVREFAVAGVLAMSILVLGLVPDVITDLPVFELASLGGGR